MVAYGDKDVRRAADQLLKRADVADRVDELQSTTGLLACQISSRKARLHALQAATSA
jgi:hypothetical protein